MELENNGQPHSGIDIAQRFLSTPAYVGVITSLREQALYKTDPVKYTILALRDKAR